MDTVNLKLVKIALDEVDTTNFERFAQAFCSAIFGVSYIPLGGTHDGGADGFIDLDLFHDGTTNSFVQVSKQSSHKDKIIQTVDRLWEYKRTPKSLIYITSKSIKDIEIDQNELSEKLDCRVSIRDSKYIEANINHSDATVAAFNSYLKPSTDHLLVPGAAKISTNISSYADRTLAVFLRQEVEHRLGNSDLQESITDSLIIWSLSDTDPATENWMTRDDILARIENSLPAVRQFIRGVLDHRLRALHSNRPKTDRKIRYYKKGNKYCLPFETREIVKIENIEDLTLRHEVSDVLRKRFDSIRQDDQEDLTEKIVDYCHKTFEVLFEKQGLEMARFVANEDSDDQVYSNVSEIVTDLLDQNELGGSEPTIRNLILKVLRGTFYDTKIEERTYLQKLSKTYVLLLMLRQEPKIVEYFKSVSSNFKLYIGTDFIVRALSEQYLNEENQTTRNLFRILVAAGSECILTEKTVDEVSTHLRSQVYEFENKYLRFENEIQSEMVEYIDRILIRSYFYSRLTPAIGIDPPNSWQAFIEQFASYTNIRNNKGSQSVAQYLIRKFGFIWESSDDLTRKLNDVEVRSLAEKIVQEKSRSGFVKEGLEVLAYNNALHTHAVYQRRKENHEHSPSNPFGFQTWWLTQADSVRRAARDLSVRNNRQQFMMRPEFLLNFISLSSNSTDIVKTYRAIFPTVLGVQLSNRVDVDQYNKIIAHANEIWKTDPARASVIVSESLNLLKGDQDKIYEYNF